MEDTARAKNLLAEKLRSDLGFADIVTPLETMMKQFNRLEELKQKNAIDPVQYSRQLTSLYDSATSHLRTMDNWQPTGAAQRGSVEDYSSRVRSEQSGNGVMTIADAIKQLQQQQVEAARVADQNAKAIAEELRGGIGAKVFKVRRL